MFKTMIILAFCLVLASSSALTQETSGTNYTPQSIKKKGTKLFNDTFGAGKYDRWSRTGRQQYNQARKALKNGDLAVYLILLEEGADLGNARCKFLLAEIYRDGVGTKRDLKKSLTYYRELADWDIPSAVYMVALYSENGWGTKQNSQSAHDLYLEAVKLNKHFDEAWRALGSLYFRGMGVERDYKKAYNYFEKAASMDNPRALFNIGLMKEKGLWTKQSLGEAILYYERASKAGDIKAMHYLATHYESGIGVRLNSGKALEYYIKAAEAGYVESFYRLGLLYKSGRAGGKDYAGALQSFARAAQSGHMDSYCEVGLIYENGLGIEMSPSTAAKWYGAAADEGCDRAQYLLGLLYLDGKGVPKNKVQGMALIKIAADLGYPEAVEYLAR